MIHRGFDIFLKGALVAGACLVTFTVFNATFKPSWAQIVFGKGSTSTPVTVQTLVVGNTPGSCPAENETVLGTGTVQHPIAVFDHMPGELIDQGNNQPLTVQAAQGDRGGITGVKFCADGNSSTLQTVPKASPVTGVPGYQVYVTTVGGTAADGLHQICAYVEPQNGIEHRQCVYLRFNTGGTMRKHFWYVDAVSGNDTNTGANPARVTTGSTGPFLTVTHCMSPPATGAN